MILLRRATAVLACAATLRVLHGLGSLPWLQVPWHDLRPWLDVAPPEDVLAAALRYTALAATYWLVGCALLWSVAGAGDRPRLRRLAVRVTPAGVRAFTERFLALALASASLAGPMTAGASAQPPPPVVATAGTDLPIPPPPRAVLAPSAPPSGDPALAPPAHADDTTVHVVQPGEHLWAIAERAIARTSDRSPCAVPDGEVAPYWRRVVAANRDGLRSGDPDLIFPGEHVQLPDPGAG